MRRWLVANCGQEGSIPTDVVDSPRVPDLFDLVGAEQVREQLDVIAMRVAQDQMVDGRERGGDGFQVGEHAVVGPAGQVVVRPPS
jgi:hypothetical protein